MAIIAKLRQSEPSKKRRGRRLRYVQTLPTLCTLGNLLCGFGAIHLCLRAMRFAGDASAPLEIITRNSQLMERLLPTHIVMAAYLIFLAMIFDALDGRLARLTRHTSDFGAQLDSLADVVSFGVAPAMIILALLSRHVPAPNPAIPWIVAPASQNPLGRIIWFMAAVYVSCAALRLARFNVETQPDEQSHMNFLGLPTPGAAAAMASMVILHDHLYLYDRAGAKAVAEHGGWFSDTILWSLPILAPLIGLLMVSRFRYIHVANRYLRGRRSFASLVKFLFVLAAVVIYPEVTLALAAVGYALSGLALAFIERLTAPGAVSNAAGKTAAEDRRERARVARGLHELPYWRAAGGAVQALPPGGKTLANQQARVRFAPSPTGYLHIGGARTALFNWLLARQTGGSFVLRIEDTDQSRHVQDSLAKILQDLRWLGLQWDEGPEVGGGVGPYFQSQRLDMYDHYCDLLLDAGQAYYAFDSAEQLAAMRERARQEKQTFKYPRPGRFPSRADAERARSQGESVVVRLKMPDHDITVSDAILGDVILNHADLEDFIIRKADGFPTYHFACVVDDARMNITHVLRGSEHLNNTPKHIALQAALGFPTPVYAHLPVIFNMRGSKMSKRDKERAAASGEPVPEIDVYDFRASGFLPEAVLNFIALLGWSPGDDREHMTVEELVETFGIERVGKTNARFDREKLVAFNTAWVAQSSADRLLAGLQDYLSIRGSAMAQEDGATLKRVLEVCAGFRTFADVQNKAGFLFEPDDTIEYDPKAIAKVLAKNDGQGYEILRVLLAELGAVKTWSRDALEALLEDKVNELGVGFGKIAQPLRVALSGTTVSPQITDTLELLGREHTLARLQRRMSLSEGPPARRHDI